MPFANKTIRQLLGTLLVIVALQESCFAQASPQFRLNSYLPPADTGSVLFADEAPATSSAASADFKHELELYASQPIATTSTNSEESSLLGIVGPYGVSDGPHFDHAVPSLSARLLRDQLNFYSPRSLLLMGFGFGTGAVLANTTLDDNIQRHLQSSLHHANSDDWLESLHANKELGDGRYTLPIFASAWALGSLLPESQFSNNSRTWGERTLRGFVVGAPPVLLLQVVTGSSRPGESPRGSEWEPFRDNNGVSGHAFMGALPFITAAKMTDKPGWKVTWYAASTLAPLSRAADGAHYPSQVALGWGIAFLAATAVQSTDDPHSRWRMLPTATANGSGMALEYKF